MVQDAAVSHARSLKEKYRLKHVEIFRECHAALVRKLNAAATQEGLSSAYAILNNEGIEQLAAILPRTNCDILQVDSMTPLKLEKYGALLVDVLKPFWDQVDALEHRRIQRVIVNL